MASIMFVGFVVVGLFGLLKWVFMRLAGKTYQLSKPSQMLFWYFLGMAVVFVGLIIPGTEIQKTYGTYGVLAFTAFFIWCVNTGLDYLWKEEEEVNLSEPPSDGPRAVRNSPDNVARVNFIVPEPPAKKVLRDEKVTKERGASN